MVFLVKGKKNFKYVSQNPWQFVYDRENFTTWIMKILETTLFKLHYIDPNHFNLQGLFDYWL